MIPHLIADADTLAVADHIFTMSWIVAVWQVIGGRMLLILKLVTIHPLSNFTVASKRTHTPWKFCCELVGGICLVIL